jgi:hypothetical protein
MEFLSQSSLTGKLPRVKFSAKIGGFIPWRINKFGRAFFEKLKNRHTTRFLRIIRVGSCALAMLHQAPQFLTVKS